MCNALSQNIPSYTIANLHIKLLVSLTHYSVFWSLCHALDNCSEPLLGTSFGASPNSFTDSCCDTPLSAVFTFRRYIMIMIPIIAITTQIKPIATVQEICPAYVSHIRGSSTELMASLSSWIYFAHLDFHTELFMCLYRFVGNYLKKGHGWNGNYR